jgi:hypothetical protein
MLRWKQSIANSAVDGLYNVKVTVEHSTTGRTLYELETLLFDPPVYSASYQEEQQKKQSPGSRRTRGGRP